ncbi:hypothetical protein A0256_00795 [Mucilaginibacter sp. PAMC 26640]|nr:hypothetical protein A0256_00795 [Mucilaginibacter sp. PAMC 26640]
MESQKEILNKVHLTCGPICKQKSIAHNLGTESIASQVKTFFTKIFEMADWPARWHCGNWSDFHGWLYICSDLAIWTSYFAIPILLFRIIKNRKDIPFPKILWLFIAFIILCGTTHFIDAIIFWWPAYRLSAIIRFLTGIVSLFTVYTLYKLLPKIYRLRTLDELEAEIVERKKAEEEIRHQQILMKATENLMAKKDEFITIASHELKTPLTSIKSYVQILLAKARTEEDHFRTEALTRVEKQANKMSTLIKNFLNNAKLLEGKFELNIESFRMHELLTEVVDDSKIHSKTHEITLKDCEDVFVMADREKISQVMENLISNAIKYSPAGSTIALGCKVIGNQAQISVSDTGIGIEQKDQSKLFDRFYRVENEKLKNVAGFGIGLFLVAEILRFHESRIFVESFPNVGSKFFFNLHISDN